MSLSLRLLHDCCRFLLYCKTSFKLLVFIPFHISHSPHTYFSPTHCLPFHSPLIHCSLPHTHTHTFHKLHVSFQSNMFCAYLLLFYRRYYLNNFRKSIIICFYELCNPCPIFSSLVVNLMFQWMT